MADPRAAIQRVRDSLAGCYASPHDIEVLLRIAEAAVRETDTEDAIRGSRAGKVVLVTMVNARNARRAACRGEATHG